MQVECPTCQKSVEWTAKARWRPFCSERCRLIDLGDWFEEQYRIADPDSVAEPGTGEHDET